VAPAFAVDDPALDRIGLLRANASRMSHAQLDEAEDLDDGDPTELASQYAALVAAHPSLRVLGGCCGTDVRHVAAIAAACTTP
jgi:homocysteine S-methyltransferase